MSERREDLLQKILDYLLENGVANLSLRPLAEAVGTSARLLIYHFGSKEELIRVVMEEVQSQFQASFADFARGRNSSRSIHPMMEFWKSLSRPQNLPYLRLLLEVQVLALQNPSHWAKYLEKSSNGWLEIIEGSLPPSKRNRALSTLYAAVMDGLILELLGTGDHSRTTKALELLIGNLNPAEASGPTHPARK